MELTRTMHNYQELVELKKDARRVRELAERLKAINPSRSNSYEEQLESTLAVIERQAEKAAKK